MAYPTFCPHPFLLCSGACFFQNRLFNITLSSEHQKTLKVWKDKWLLAITFSFSRCGKHWGSYLQAISETVFPNKLLGVTFKWIRIHIAVLPQPSSIMEQKLHLALAVWSYLVICLFVVFRSKALLDSHWHQTIFVAIFAIKFQWSWILEKFVSLKILWS